MAGMTDVFHSNIFSLVDLTSSIYNLPYVPHRLSDLGIFEERGITTTTVVVEQKQGILNLVQSVPRGSPPVAVARDKRSARSFLVPHLPQRASLLADEVQNLRAFGGATVLDSVSSIRDDLLLKMKRNLDATIEHHRTGAIQGTILDADGSTIYNLYTEFGVGQTSVNFALGTAATNIRGKVNQVIKAIRTALGGVPFNGVQVFCGQTFWEDLIDHPDVKDIYKYYQEGAQVLRMDPRAQFPVFGCIFEYYYGFNGNTPYIADTEAYAVPLECPGLFVTAFAPANYIETVNTVGQPYYAKAEVMDLEKGIDIEMQSNPMSLCTRPGALIKCTVS
jgi:hypothetical protein